MEWYSEDSRAKGWLGTGWLDGGMIGRWSNWIRVAGIAKESRHYGAKR